MAIAASKPFSMQSPEHVAMEYGGNKQKIAQAVQMGIIDPTSGLMAGMFIDRMRAAQVQEQAPNQTVAQQVLGPQGPQGGLGGLPPGGPPSGAPPMQMASAAPQGMPAPQGGPPPQGPVSMAEGGLTSLPVPDYMFDEQTFAGGGIVAFAKGDEVKAGGAREKEAWRASLAMEKKYGVPASLTFAQWKLESGSGERMPEGSNNPFGVKATGNSPYVEANTTEFVNGKPMRTKERFRKYNSIMDAFDDRTKMLATSPLYKETRERNYNPFVLGDTYATDPKYGEKIATLMQAGPATPTQVARNEPPASTVGQIVQRGLPGIPSAEAGAAAPAPSPPQSVVEPGVSFRDRMRALNAPTPGKKSYSEELAELKRLNAAPRGPASAAAPPTSVPTKNVGPPPGLHSLLPTLFRTPEAERSDILTREAHDAHAAPPAPVAPAPVAPAPVAPAPVAPAPVEPNPIRRGGIPFSSAASPIPAQPPPVAAKETAEEAMARILAANKKENFWNTMAQAGFGMMAGTSQNALTNIGAGLSAALPGMSAANKSDRELALKQQEMAQQRDMNEKQLAAQTPAALQYARSQVNLFKSKTPNATSSQLEEVFSKAMVDYPRSIQRPTNQMTPDQAMRRALDASMTGDIPKGPDGEKLSVGQYAQQLMSQYGGGGLGGADLGIQDYTSFF